MNAVLHTPAHKAPQSWMSPVAATVPAHFIGTKEVIAWREEREPAPSHEDPLAQHRRPGYAVKYPDGHHGWSPKDAFEAAYRVTEGADQALTFGDALHFLKQGRRVARQGWNGKAMYLGLCSEWNGAVSPDTGTFTLLPFIYMRTAQADIVPWLASQTDMLAEDWVLLG